MTINYCYWEHNYEYHYTKQVEKEVLKSYSWKQGKASSASNAMAF